MNSLILKTSVRYLLALSLVLSLFILWRGHNAPGGGFIGGLIAAVGIIVYGLGLGLPAARRILLIDPRALAGLGVGIAVLSGMPAFLSGAPYLTHLWAFPGGVAIGTALMFDVGVYLAVIGTVLTFLFEFLEP